MKNLNKTTLPKSGKKLDFEDVSKIVGILGCEFVQHHSVPPLLRNLLFVRTPVGSNPVGQGEAKQTTSDDSYVKNLNETTLPKSGKKLDFEDVSMIVDFFGWDLDGLYCEFVQHHSVTPLLRNLLFVRTPVGSNPVGQGEAKKQQMMMFM